MEFWFHNFLNDRIAGNKNSVFYSQNGASHTMRMSRQNEQNKKKSHQIYDPNHSYSGYDLYNKILTFIA